MSEGPRPPMGKRVAVTLAAVVPFGLLVATAAADGSVGPVQAIAAFLLAFVLGVYGTLTYTAGMTRRALRARLEARVVPVGSVPGPCPDCGENHVVTEPRLGFRGDPHPDGGVIVTHTDPDIDPPCRWNCHAETPADAQEKVQEHMMTDCPRRSVLEDLMES